MKNKKYFLEFLDNDIIKGNIKKIPQSIFNRISLLKEKAKLAKNKNRCYIYKSSKTKKVWVETQPYGFHDLQSLCQECINNKIELLNNKKRCNNNCLYCYWKD